MNDETTVEQGFYKGCAELLGCAEPTYNKFPYRKRTRWNNRSAGCGKFAGHGSVRIFSLELIHVMFHTPSCNKVCKSVDEALEAIRIAMDKK